MALIQLAFQMAQAWVSVLVKAGPYRRLSLFWNSVLTLATENLGLLKAQILIALWSNFCPLSTIRPSKAQLNFLIS